MFYSRFLVLFALSLTFLLGAGNLSAQSGQNQQGPCGNPGTKEPDEDCDKNGQESGKKDPCDEDDGNDGCAFDPINVTSGDLQKAVTDLKVWGGVGDHRLAWRRHSHSRFTAGVHPFGSTNDRHSYQWEIADAGVDDQGRPVLQVKYPGGGGYRFTKTSATVWSPIASCPDTMTQNTAGDEFFLQRKSGFVYRIAKLQDGSGAWFYRVEDFTDTTGNTYVFTYDTGAPTRLVKVAEPGGRSLEIAWTTRTVSSATLLHTISSTPPNNAWSTVSLSVPGNFRHVWYQSADYGYGNVAEVEFYDSLGNKHSGTSFGSTPFWNNNAGYSYDKVFDGNVGTFYNTAASLPSGGVAGLDLGTEEEIATIKFFPRIGYQRMFHNPGYAFTPTTSGTFWGAEDAPATVDVIGSVSSKDPAGNVIHTVTYTYDTFDDQSLPDQKYAVLSSVNYDDGTQATFSHIQLYPGTPPLVSSYNEPRYDQPLVRAKTLYKTGLSAVLGAIWQVRNPDTDEVLVTWGASPASAHVGMLWCANGGTESFPMWAQVTSRIDAYGNVTSFGYTAGGYGYLNKVTDAAGNITQYTRDAHQNILTKTLPDGKTLTYTRDSLGLVLTKKDENNRVTTYTRDGNHRVTQITHPDSTTEIFTYNTFGQILTHTRRDGSTVSNAYDATGRKTSSTDALGKVTTYAYDSADRLASITDPLSRTTSYAYNHRGQITQITYPDSTTRNSTYDQYGNLLTSTDEMGHVTTKTYDWYNRLTSVTDALNRTTTYDYTVDGVGAGGGCGCAHIESHPTKITSPSGRVTYFTYDLLWRKTSQTTAYGTGEAATTNYDYDVLSRLTTITDPLNQVWTTDYDNRGRKISATDPLNQTTSYTYDGVGNLLTTTLPDSRVTTNTYDAMNRLATTKDPLNQVTTYEYDGMGRKTRLFDTKSNLTTWTYDARGSLTGKTYANGDAYAYTYDDAGRMATHTTPKGDVCTYTYDLRGRQTLADWNTATPDVSRTYNACGQLLTVSDAASTVTYTYDAAHQLLTETQTLASQPAKTVSYTYDADGNKASIIYPSGEVVEYAWTARSQLSAVTNDGPPPLANYAYDLAGRLTSVSHENGVIDTKSYDNANRLLSNIHTKGGPPLSGHTYVLDTAGRRTGETFSDGTTPARTYGYDSTDQVTSADYGSSQTDSYAYDPMGNRTTATFSRSVGVPPTSGTITYTTNAANQYTAITGSAAPTYDANGNILTCNGVTYTWDSENRLLFLTEGTTTVTYTYDALHRRTTKTANATTTRYIYDGWNVIEEYNNGTLAKSHTWGTDLSGSLQGAGGVGGLLLTRNHATSAVSHFHYDGNGNVTQLTDGTGSVAATYRYDAFGNVLVSSGLAAADNKYRFSTKPVDEEISSSFLHYYGYRYYMTSIGRWLSRDPIEEKGGQTFMGLQAIR